MTINQTYNVPPKVDELVRRTQEEIRSRLSNVEPAGCPLQGHVGQEPVSLARDEVDLLESMVGGLSGWTTSVPVKVRVGCCSALRDPVCYLEKGSEKQPRVSCKDECPVYRRVVELLNSDNNR